ncbi:Hypothetical protein A7982_05519 [Minicystis rosea]|nr:Hypothetical protein A7982_05519 [Minicystis rosea]
MSNGAGASVTLDGPNVQISGAEIRIVASGDLILQGAMVKIN